MWKVQLCGVSIGFRCVEFLDTPHVSEKECGGNYYDAVSCGK